MGVKRLSAISLVAKTRQKWQCQILMLHMWGAKMPSISEMMSLLEQAEHIS